MVGRQQHMLIGYVFVCDTNSACILFGSTAWRTPNSGIVAGLTRAVFIETMPGRCSANQSVGHAPGTAGVCQWYSINLICRWQILACGIALQPACFAAFCCLLDGAHRFSVCYFVVVLTIRILRICGCGHEGDGCNTFRSMSRNYPNLETTQPQRISVMRTCARRERGLYRARWGRGLHRAREGKEP